MPKYLVCTTKPRLLQVLVQPSQAFPSSLCIHVASRERERERKTIAMGQYLQPSMYCYCNDSYLDSTVNGDLALNLLFIRLLVALDYF